MATIGFIGCGNMAQPIIRNVKEKNVFEANSIFVFDTDSEKLKDFCEKTGVNTAESAEFIASLDCVMLCVKPQVFPDVLPKIADKISEHDSLVISIAAGKTTEYIESFLGKTARVCRIFPNLNAQVGAAISSYTGGKNATDDDIALTGKIAKSYGEAIELGEDSFSCFGVLGGCVPAYAFMFISSLARAGIADGLDPSVAKKTAIQAVLGSALLLKEKCTQTDETDPMAVIDDWVKKVCSPGGTTIEGVNSLKENNLDKIVADAFHASYERDKTLSKG